MDVAELEKIGRQLARDRAKADVTNQTARTAAIEAHQAGIAETRIAAALKVDRLTVRRWLGK
jgi:hypothetical protein